MYDYVDIAWRFTAMGVKQGSGWRKQAIFELNASISRKR